MKSTSTKNKRKKEQIKNTDNLKSLRDNLLRLTSKHTYDDLEKLTNVPDSSFNAIVNGDRPNPKIDNLISIAKGLNVSIDSLVGLNAKEEILNAESVDKLLNHNFDYYEAIASKYILNQMICSDYFDEFIRAFSNYLKFDYEEYEEKLDGNALRNYGSQELYPTPEMYQFYFEKKLSDSAKLMANFTQRKIEQYEKNAEHYKKAIDNDDPELIYGFNKQKYDEYSDLLEKHKRNIKMQADSEKHFREMEESFEELKEEEDNGKK